MITRDAKSSSIITSVIKKMLASDAEVEFSIGKNNEVIIHTGISSDGFNLKVIKDNPVPEVCLKCNGKGKIVDPDLPSASDPSSGDLFGCGFYVTCVTCKGTGNIEKEICYNCKGEFNRSELIFGPDPFVNEIQHDDTDVYLCDDCYRSSAMEI